MQHDSEECRVASETITINLQKENRGLRSQPDLSPPLAGPSVHLILSREERSQRGYPRIGDDGQKQGQGSGVVMGSAVPSLLSHPLHALTGIGPLGLHPSCAALCPVQALDYSSINIGPASASQKWIASYVARERVLRTHRPTIHCELSASVC